MLPLRFDEARVASSGRVEYLRRAGSTRLVEWYENDEHGLEQGFTIDASPCDGQHELLLDVGVRGLQARKRGRDVALFESEGHQRLWYSHLVVTDARRHIVPADLSVAEGNIRIQLSLEGVAFPVTIDPLIWTAERLLVALDPMDNDVFGSSVALSGDTALIGAPVDQDNLQGRPGAAYVFQKSGHEWTEVQKLMAPGSGAGGDSGVPDDGFGVGVALNQDTALIDARANSSTYVYSREGETWAFQQELETSAPGSDGDRGDNLDVSGDTAMVGVPMANDGGAVHVFERSGATWSELLVLRPDDTTDIERFGTSISIAGDTALIGAPNSTVDSTAGAGAAFVFVRSGNSWAQQQRLVASEPVDGEQLGRTVSLVGDVAMVGAPNPDAYAESAVHVFVRDGNVWTEQEPLTTETAGHSQLGSSLAFSGEYVLTLSHGGAFWFRCDGGTCAEDGFFDADNLSSVALSASSAIVGERFATSDATWQGAAHAFTLAYEVGDACAVDTDCSSEYCVDGVCCETACDGACDACSVATGSSDDGSCEFLPAGDSGSPTCAAPLACTGASPDCDACSSDSECATGHYCDRNGVCQLQKELAEACDTSGDASSDCKQTGCRVCTSGQCVDEVCCNRTCSAAESCVAKNKVSGEDDGVCGEADSAVPGSECTDDATCTSGFCSADGVCCDRACSGAEACRAENKISGEDDGVCGEADSAVPGSECTDDATCTSSFCSADGVCCDRACSGAEACRAENKVSGEDDGVCDLASNSGLGSACESPDTCESRQCVEGVCCDTACDNECVSCLGSLKVDGEDGTCGFIATGTDPYRECEDNSACPQRPQCNGEGRCACAASSCENEFTRVDSEGKTTDCSPFRCSGGLCLEKCDTGADCMPGARCTAAGHCERIDTPSDGHDSGCGCRMAGRSPPTIPLGLALAAGIMAVGCRRRAKL